MSKDLCGGRGRPCLMFAVGATETKTKESKMEAATPGVLGVLGVL